MILQWRHNERDGVSNYRCLDGLLNLFFMGRSKKTSKLRATRLYEGANIKTTVITVNLMRVYSQRNKRATTAERVRFGIP